MYKQYYIPFKIILNKRFLVFKTQGLYRHELIFCKWVNLHKPDTRIKVRMKSLDESCRCTTKNCSGQDKLFRIGALR